MSLLRYASKFVIWQPCRYAALLPRGGTQGQKLIVEPRDLRAFDQDVGLASPVFYTFASEEYKVTMVVMNKGWVTNLRF